MKRPSQRQLADADAMMGRVVDVNGRLQWKRKPAPDPSRIMIDGRWANPPMAVVRRIYREANRKVPNTSASNFWAKQARGRKVQAEFLKRLYKAGIYVENGYKP